ILAIGAEPSALHAEGDVIGIAEAVAGISAPAESVIGSDLDAARFSFGIPVAEFGSIVVPRIPPAGDRAEPTGHLHLRLSRCEFGAGSDRHQGGTTQECRTCD